MNDSLLREYLLGRLAESERHEIENRAFEDDTFEEHLREVEYDLLDDWARGEISEADRAVMEKRFSAEKLAVARSMRKRSVLARPPGPSGAWMAVAAGILFCIIPAGYFWRETDRLRTELQEAKKQPALSPASAPSIVTLALNIPSTRGAAGAVFTIPATTGLVQITMNVEPGYEFYEVRVESADRGVVFSQGLRSSNSSLVLNIPASLLRTGNYDFVLSGQRNGSTALLASYSCRIEVR